MLSEWVGGYSGIRSQTAASAEPGKGAFDDPPAWQHFEAFSAVGSLDDLERPASKTHKRAAKLWPRIATICKHMAQFRGFATQLGKDVRRAVAVLNVGRVNDAGNQVSAGVGHDVPLPTFDPLPRIEPEK